MRRTFFYICMISFFFTFLGGISTEVQSAEDIFFPTTNETWEKLSPESIGWDTAALKELNDWHSKNKTYSFMMLHKGKIVVEEYWDKSGNRVTDQPDAYKFKQKIYSCAKSVTSFLVGLAQEQGKLKITDPASKYLGTGWSKKARKKLKISVLPTKAQEKAIQIQHLLKMASGIRKNEILPPETFWEYNTDVYHMTHFVMEKATGMTMNEYFYSQLAKLGFNEEFADFAGHTMNMNARSMARFGILILAEGLWNGTQIMQDKNFFKQMLNTTQSMNPSYGLLWWLNGKDFFLASIKGEDGNPIRVDRPITKDGPIDLVCARGKYGQGIYISPSLDLVVVRQGMNKRSDEPDVADEGTFEEMWAKISPVIANTAPSDPKPETSNLNSNPYILQPKFQDDQNTSYFDKFLTIPAWENPDVRVLSATDNSDVTDAGILNNARYVIKVRVRNEGPEAAKNVKVTGYYCKFGVNSEFKTFGTPATIDSIPSGETVFAEIEAKSKISGHVCVKAAISCSNDSNLSDNQGQRNVQIEKAYPGKRVRKTMNVSNLALVKQADGNWKLETISQLILKSKIQISPQEHNTPENLKKIKISYTPQQFNFNSTSINIPTTKTGEINIKFGKKLPTGISIKVKIKPVVSSKKALMDGCTWHFNIIKKRGRKSFGGM